MNRLHFFASLPNEISEELSKMEAKKYTLRQLYQWVYEKHVTNPQMMSNIPQTLREAFEEHIDFSIPVILQTVSSQDASSKFVLELEDQSKIEMVLMPGEGKNTVCISSQVGCSRKCSFCATGLQGLKRNLSANEIVGQVYLASREFSPGKLTNIVLMGMGEPLDNYDNVFKAIQVIQSDPGMKFSPRHITISTSGVIPNIRKLGTSGLKVKLAVSLNAAIDTSRDRLMPINRIYPLGELKKTLLDYRKRSSFRITYEYIMIPDFNMGEKDVTALKKFLADQSCKLNLISYNPVKGLPFRKPELNEVERFMDALSDLKVAVMLRKSRGSDINAACGQLAGEVQLNRQKR